MAQRTSQFFLFTKYLVFRGFCGSLSLGGALSGVSAVFACPSAFTSVSVISVCRLPYPKFKYDQNAQPPARNMGISRPSPAVPVIFRSSEPIIKSSCIMESFMPSARHSSRLMRS